MRACSTASFVPLGIVAPALSPRVVRRFAGALALSAALHIALSATVAPPNTGARTARVAVPPSVITARLSFAEPVARAAEAAPPAVAPAPAAAPAPVPRRARAPTRTLASAEAARKAASPPAVASAEGAWASPERVDPIYYPARQLDVYPTLASALDLTYSHVADGAGTKGRVLLLVLIGAEGTVDDVSVVDAEPRGYFEDGARRTFLAARFNPARKNGRPVKSRVLIHVSYGANREAR